MGLLKHNLIVYQGASILISFVEFSDLGIKKQPQRGGLMYYEKI